MAADASTSPEDRRADHRSGWILCALVLIAAVLRAWQLERWLPAYYEEATPVLRAMAFWADFRFDPGFYNYPALIFSRSSWLRQGTCSGP